MIVILKIIIIDEYLLSLQNRMKKTEAYKLLNCSNNDDLDEVISFYLFEIKSKYLQTFPPLKISNAHLLRLKKIHDAYILLSENSSVNKYESFELLEINQPLISFLSEYQNQISILRLKISRSVSPSEFMEVIEIVKQVQINLFIKLNSYLKGILRIKYPIKLSESINVFVLQKELLTIQLDDDKISEYIRKQIEEKEFDDFSEMTKSVINATQQIEFNGIRGEI